MVGFDHCRHFTSRNRNFRKILPGQREQQRNEAALVKALKKKQIAGAALDVYENEPQISRELLDRRNVVLSPHIASATRETRDKMADYGGKNCIAALKGGRPPHLVNTKILG